MKKPITQTDSAEVRAVLLACSKTALADLCIDLMRRCAGEGLEGRELAAELRLALDPILLARGELRAARKRQRKLNP